MWETEDLQAEIFLLTLTFFYFPKKITESHRKQKANKARKVLL